MKEFEVSDIEVAYSERTIIEKMSLNIPMGKITTIIGPNGCGKSTLLKALGRILKVKQGNILLNGQDIYNLSTKELAKKLAILPQSPIAPEGLTVEELVSYGRYPHQRGLGKLNETDKSIINWALNVTGLGELAEHVVDHLSGGQRQRVWVALALAQQTDIILLDEPTTYLDMAYQLEILELLEELNKNHNVTIVMVLHDLNLASKYADYLIAMRDGRIMKKGAPLEVICSSILQKVYQIDAKIMMDEDTGKPICVSYQLLKERKLEPRKEKVIS